MDIYWLEQTVADVPVDNLWLGAGEKACLNALRFPKRRADWRLGRWTAKQAVTAHLNLPSTLGSLANVEIRAASSGAPEVFLAGVRAPAAISLSHRSGTALCAVASLEGSFGCDLETVEARSAAFISDYFTDKEKQLIEDARAEGRTELVALMWSAKESALKALREGLRLDTRRVTVNPCVESQSAARSWDGWHPIAVSHKGTPDFSGWWRVEGSLVRTIVSSVPLKIPLRIQPMRLSEGYAVCACGTSSLAAPRPS